jgi:uncharacterized protein (TIGR02246 family)
LIEERKGKVNEMKTTPDGVIRDFADRLNRGDVEGALALYEPEAAFLAEPGKSVHGSEAIRHALERFAALEPELTGEIQGVRQNGDIALVLNRWSLKGRTPEGPVEMSGTSADVLRRQADGTWRVLIDDPWGGSVG